MPPIAVYSTYSSVVNRLNLNGENDNESFFIVNISIIMHFLKLMVVTRTISYIPHILENHIGGCSLNTIRKNNSKCFCWYFEEIFLLKCSFIESKWFGKLILNNDGFLKIRFYSLVLISVFLGRNEMMKKSVF